MTWHALHIDIIHGLSVVKNISLIARRLLAMLDGHLGELSCVALSFPFFESEKVHYISDNMALCVSIFQYLTDLASICFLVCTHAFTLELVFIAIGSIRAIWHDVDFREARVRISLIATIVIEVLIAIVVRNLVVQHLFCSLLR